MNNSVIIPTILLLLAASLLLLARNVWRVIFGVEKRFGIEAFYAVLCFVASSFIVIDLMRESQAFGSSGLEIFSNLAVLILFTATTIFSFRAFILHGPAKKLRRSIHSWLLVLLALSMSGWFYRRVQNLNSCIGILGIEGVLPGVVEREERAWAMTDEGAIIPLYHLATDDIQFEQYAASANQRFQNHPHLMIHRENADKMANCHGWVFTDGRYLLKGADVERILCDNCYVVVSDPKPSDIVIYRDHLGTILHTALVQAILADGTVITESKWGVDQRFLHLPVDQPYSTLFEYYRTSRLNRHLISIRTSAAREDFLDD